MSFECWPLKLSNPNETATVVQVVVILRTDDDRINSYSLSTLYALLILSSATCAWLLGSSQVLQYVASQNKVSVRVASSVVICGLR